jgi:hypothetical protein
MIEMLKIKNCWLILRTYNYTNNLRISNSCFEDELVQKRKGVSFELSQHSNMFLRKIFSMHSRNGEELSSKDLDEIFCTYPDGVPRDSFETYLKKITDEEDTFISKSEWFIFWNHLTYKDYQTSFKFMTYIGL